MHNFCHMYEYVYIRTYRRGPSQQLRECPQAGRFETTGTPPVQEVGPLPETRPGEIPIRRQPESPRKVLGSLQRAPLRGIWGHIKARYHTVEPWQDPKNGSIEKGYDKYIGSI